MLFFFDLDVLSLVPIGTIAITTALNTATGLSHTNRTSLMVLLAEQSTLVEVLCRGWDVDGRVPVEEVDGLERDLEDFARHDGEVFDAWDLCVSALDNFHF